MFQPIVIATLRWIDLGLSKELIETIKESRKARPQLLSALRLEMTLDKQVPKGVRKNNSSFNNPSETYVKDAAFGSPREFKIMIEKGNFMPQWRVGQYHGEDDRWSRRLLFDQSPCPTCEGFRDYMAGDDTSESLEGMAKEVAAITSFVAGELPKSAGKTRATNDVPS